MDCFTNQPSPTHSFPPSPRGQAMDLHLRPSPCTTDTRPRPQHAHAMSLFPPALQPLPPPNHQLPSIPQTTSPPATPPTNQHPPSPLARPSHVIGHPTPTSHTIHPFPPPAPARLTTATPSAARPSGGRWSPSSGACASRPPRSSTLPGPPSSPPGIIPTRACKVKSGVGKGGGSTDSCLDHSRFAEKRGHKNSTFPPEDRCSYYLLQ